MKIKERKLINEIKRISALRPQECAEDLVSVNNATDLQLLYRREDYAVFRVDAERSVMIYAKEGKAQEEYKKLQAGAGKGISPQVYDWGTNYVVMELLEAPTLAQYLGANPPTEELTASLVRLLSDLDILGFSMNQAMEDIYVLAGGSLKAVNMKTNGTAKPRLPKKMIKGMGKQAEVFLEYVRKIDDDLFRKWSCEPEFDALISEEGSR